MIVPVVPLVVRDSIMVTMESERSRCATSNLIFTISLNYYLAPRMFAQ